MQTTILVLDERTDAVAIAARCHLCRAPVRARYPERWRDCDRCGERVRLELPDVADA